MAGRKMGIMAFLFCVCLWLMPCRAEAASGPVSLYQTCRIVVTYGCNDTLFSDLPTKLYKIADVSSQYEYIMNARYAESGLDLNGVQSVQEWNVIRDTLLAIIVANGFQEDLQGKTDEYGKVYFDRLTPGLYLIVTEPILQEEMHYVFQPTLVSLPIMDVDGQWQYDVAVTAKAEMLPPAEDEEEVQWSVLKLWKADKGTNRRPDSIQVDLYRNGSFQQAVMLSDDNQWSYQWITPNDGADWTVMERNVPAGYAVTLEKRGNTFVLTNRWEQEEPDTPPGTKPETGDTSNILLYTMLLFVSGITMILLGMMGKSKRYEETN